MYQKLGTPRRRENMAVVENLNKSLYKTTIFYLKIIPVLLAMFDFSNTLLSYFEIEVPVISYIADISFLPIIFIYLISYVFRFCEYHRMPLHYIVVNNLVCIYDEYVGIPVSDRNMLSIYIMILFISIITTIVIYVKSNKRTVK